MSDIAIGTIVGGYEILEEIGQGGMATVYRARQLSMQRAVAIKILPRQFLRQATSLDRFQQEAKIVARLEHRAIVPVHDYGEHDGLPYIVMRCMDGGSVDELLVHGAISPQRALEILRQIAPALDYAHQQGVLHRDLKPSNILLDTNGDAYLTDFGIARIVGDNAPSLTTTGVVGTPSYMSPEQAQGHPLDARSDVYALGVVLFEMLTGVRPFEGETPYSVAVKHVTEAPPSACALNPRLPRAVEQVLYKALEKNRDLRYATAGELTEALAAALKATPSPLPAEALTDTEPSLERTLREAAERQRREGVPAAFVQPPPAVVARPPAPNLQVLAPYVAPPSQAYPRAVSRPRARRPAPRRGRWLTWAMALSVMGSVMLALLVGGTYYLLNEPAPAQTPEVRYAATAIFKLTATKQAILDELAMTSTAEPEPTAPPTNTPFGARPTPLATLPPQN